MFQGDQGRRHEPDDTFQLRDPLRERTDGEHSLLSMLDFHACEVRDFINTALGASSDDHRCRATALTKLDELVFWVKKGLDA